LNDIKSLFISLPLLANNKLLLNYKLAHPPFHRAMHLAQMIAPNPTHLL